MSFKKRIEEILKKNLTEKCFELWKVLDSKIPNIWEKKTSSTGKYHKKGNIVPTCAEHVFDMIYVADKLISMWNIKPKTSEADKLFLSIVLHDSFKYGLKGTNPYTHIQHDKLAADAFIKNKNSFLSILNEQQFDGFIDSIRYHAGKWSTDANKDFNFKDVDPIVQFIHTLDMLSTKDLIKVKEDNKIPF